CSGPCSHVVTAAREGGASGPLQLGGWGGEGPAEPASGAGRRGPPPPPPPHPKTRASPGRPRPPEKEWSGPAHTTLPPPLRRRVPAGPRGRRPAAGRWLSFCCGGPGGGAGGGGPGAPATTQDGVKMDCIARAHTSAAQARPEISLPRTTIPPRRAGEFTQ